MKKRYEITANIGKEQIEEFVNDFFAFLKLKKNNPNNEPNVINIVFKSNINTETGEIVENEIKGYIDPLYLSYVFLFLQETSISKVNFIFEYADEDEWKKLNDRFYSLKTQLEQFIYIIPNSGKRITLLKHCKICSNPSDENNLSQKGVPNHSEKFIPPIFIKKNDIESAKLFFKPINKFGNTDIEIRLSKLQKKYEENIIEIVKHQTFEEHERKHETTISKIKSQLLLDNLNFIETTILLLAINSETFDSMQGLTKEKRIQNKEQNLNKILYYTKYVREVSKGLQELAINIAQHSNSDGIITARVFDKKKIIQLKGPESVEAKFAQKSDIENFLDINVIDIGKISVKDKYIQNLSENKNEVTLIGLEKTEIDEDIKIIRNYNHEDFYVITEKFFELHHQQNKLISRYGLHHFTAIIKDELGGFIKTSSQKENAILNDISSNKETFFPNTGTLYNCIVPLRPIVNINNTNFNDQNEKFININSLDTFINLQSYKITPDYNIRTNKNEQINYIYQYPLENQLTNLEQKKHNYKSSKYKYLAYIYNDIYKRKKIPTNGILLLDAEKIKIDDYSDCLRLLSALNSKYKDIIIYNSKLSYFYEIKEIRKKYEDVYHKISNNEENFVVDYMFWSKDARVLFYSKKESNINEKYFRYGANLLIGENHKQFNFINYSVWKYRYSYGIKDKIFPIYNTEDYDSNPPEKIYGSKIFLNKKLNYFELLINIIDTINEQKISLFEKSVQYSLNKRFGKYKNSNNSGYKIPDTHFRLGSKIHITDFYYAKRLFQNSFFSLPLAFLLSNYIIKNKIIDEIKHNERISIIGYETYSNLISSFVRLLLEKKYPEKKFSNIVITKDGKLSREYEKLYENVITIVPIASTFSTSIKIKKDLDNIINMFNQKYINSIKNTIEKITDKSTKESVVDELNKSDFSNSKMLTYFINKIKALNISDTEKVNIINTLKKIRTHTKIVSYLNIVLVGHKEQNDFFDSKKYSNDEIQTFSKGILKSFNWIYYDFNNKIIKIKPYSQTNNIQQKYFIPLYSKWHKAEDCGLCFPNKEPLKNEKCLIETGQASITPQIVFDYPKTYDKYNHENKKLNLKDSLLVGNLYRNSSKYMYFIKPGNVIKNNIDLIRKWLIKLKNEKFNTSNERIVLISPSYLAKSNFINLVNTHIFNDTANSVLISLDDEFIENSEALYSDALHNAGTIIYVDDIMHTSNSFFKANNVVKYINNKNIDYIITLINRIPYNTENNIRSIIGEKILYYQKINLPVIYEHGNKSPADIKRQKFDFLSNISSLDAVKERFIKKKEKLLPIDIYQLSEYDPIIRKSIDDNISFKNKMLFELYTLNALYKIFNYDYKNKKYKNEDFIKNIFNPDSNSFEQLKEYVVSQVITEDTVVFNNFKNEISNIILKSITDSPLGRHKTIREKNYKWILSELDKLVNEIKDYNPDNISDEKLKELFYRKSDLLYSKIDTLKFLLKRAVSLQNNYIISNDFFDIVQKIILLINKYNNSSISKRKKVETGKLDFFSDNDKITNITSKEFIYYIISLIQELLYEHEVKSIKLEEYLNNYIKKFDVSYHGNNENGNFAHFIRLLKLENTELFYKLYKYYINDKQKYVEKKDIEQYETDPRYAILLKLLKSKNENSAKTIINKFISLCERLDTDIPDDTRTDTKEFIRTILQDIEYILDDDNILASYLTVNHNNEKINIKENDLTVFKGRQFVDNNGQETNLLYDLTNSLTFKMFNGISSGDKNNNKLYEISNFEIYKENDNYHYRKDLNIGLIDNYTEINTLKNKIEFSILLIRISDFYEEHNKSFKTKLYPQAVLTIISKKGKRFNEESLRLILLLRHFISKYLKSGIPYKIYMELKKYDEREKYIRATRHQFANMIAEIKKYLTKIEASCKSSDKDDFQIVEILLNAMLSQKFSSSQMRQKVSIKLKDIKKLIELIFSADISNVGEKITNYEVTIENNNLNNEYLIPKIFVQSMLIQILFNLRQYSNKEKKVTINIDVNSEQITFDFKNYIDINEVVGRFNSINYLNAPVPEGLYLIKRQLKLLNEIIKFIPTNLKFEELTDESIYKSIFIIKIK